MPPEARWLAGGGGVAGLGLVLEEPGGGAVAYGLALVLVLASAGATPPVGPAWIWPVFLVLATGLGGLGAALWPGDPAVIASVLLLQAGAGLAAASRPVAVAGAAAIAGAVVVASWPSGQVGAWLVAPVAGLGLAGTLAALLDAMAQQGLHVAEPAPAHLGMTRVELEQAQRELVDVTSQLHREAHQRRQAEAQALAALKARTAFLSVMSHELRTPLNQIIGYSELLLEEMADGSPDDAAGDVERIHYASLNLLEMVTNVLDLSKIEAGTMAVAVETFEVAELVENLVQSFATQAHQGGNVIRVRCPEGLAPARTDRTKLRTVLANLISNACKFTKKGTIRVAVSETPEGGTHSLVVEVSDTGIGIPPEEIDRLFAAFVQADGSTTRRHDGSGLGLTLAHHFCAMLGGEITVESTPDVGSTFRVRVPREFVDPRRAGHVLTSMASPAAR
ncbi:MAG TPA: HAMP domain-containing sensor histidine kinase [Nannocystis sp.]